MERIIKKISILLILLLSSNYIQSQTKTTSDLWGEKGELWDSRGRLSDFSYAGYGGGYAEKPVFSNIINVLDQGVVANDGLSDILAIDVIIKSAPDNSIIYFPAGRYVIDDWLKIERSNVVLRGAGDGADGTVFYMPNSATDINGEFSGLYATGDKGHIIEFFGRYSSKVTKITEEALRSDKVIVVEDASKLKQGDIIEINADGNNPVNGELWYEYFNNQTQDYPEPHSSWLSADGGNMFHTIEKIEGNLITLREPLRLRLKPSWEMFVYQRNSALQNVGMEDIRIEVIEKEHAEHLTEPGYNPIGFNSCYNFWCKNLTIVNADNPIFLKYSAYGEIDDIVIEGRDGHHGFTYAYSSSNVISNININTSIPYTHAITFIHKSNGNVLRNVKGASTISLDFHRNAPFSNLICDVRTDWNHRSTGTNTAGPYAGARNVYWGLYGESIALYWGDINNTIRNHWGMYQSTIVSALNTGELFTEEREWYEHVPNLAEKDLYEIQQKYHTEFIHESVFNSNEYGNRADWKERDASRWKVQNIEGMKYYSLFAEELPLVSTGKLSEYSVVTIPQKAIYEIETSIKSIDKLENRTESDIVLVTSFIDDNNYLFARVSTDKEKSGIFSVKNGATSKLIGSSSVLQNDEEVLLKLGVENNQIIFTMNNGLVAKVAYSGTIPFGKTGVGSSKNGILFQEFQINDTVTSNVNDSDNDGVPNSEDLCSSTPEGTVVDNQGCPKTQLPSDNFTIETTGETCVDKKNGKLVINAGESRNYILSMNGVDYDFTTTKIIDGLSPGTYDLCISISGDDYEQCYSVIIEGGVNLSGKIKVTKQKAYVSVAVGTAPYTVYKNGEAIFETYQSSFSLPVNHGDQLKVVSKTACEGGVSKSINFLEEIKAYPNPSNGLFEIYIPNNIQKIDVEIYNMLSQLIEAQIYPVSSGMILIDITDKPSGVYIVKVNGDKPVFVKVIKE
ncbi:Por secretion system C-terminal sorting domain-containing protein [Lutibacter agarilyticus]|uniref:Por secretion system C-terminal sorting domain-containing protein n=1 Tax=Lutibacter agarilyticus TaxID=1109740 RepID=A0A238Y5D4_9FLAO|nr:T9SS type A sorting domain-containing protein [Lutibacter agarilyticus]SNR66038.1 Por secretion system C-terminal sorting domain-containing protein [Lutibacter agarilyticus]